MIVFNMSITVMILACGFFTPWREMGWPNFLESALGVTNFIYFYLNFSAVQNLCVRDI